MKFSDLVTTAALGTGQRPFRLEDVPEPLQRLADPADAPPHQLLDVAAGWVVAARSVPPTGVDVREHPEGPEPTPECSPALTVLLRRIIELPNNSKLLGQTCAAVAAAGWRLPHRLAPAMYEQARRHNDPALRAQVLTVAGARGRWLLANYPELLASSAPRIADWDGPLGARLAKLRELNGVDPQAAVAALGTEWTREPVDHRRALLEVLADRPHPAHIAVWESALQDRSKQVRALAQDSLARLPMTPWRERLHGYAAAVRIVNGDITLSERPSGAQAEQDGVAGAEARLAILAGVAPSEWPAIAPVTFATLLSCTAEDPAAFNALARAAGNAQDQDAADRVLAALERSRRDDVTAISQRLLTAASPRAIQQAAGNHDLRPLAVATLMAAPRPWPAELADKALTCLRHWRPQRTDIAVLAPVIEDAIPPDGAAWALSQISAEPAVADEDLRPISRLITVLTLRAAVYAEVSPHLRATTEETP